MNYTPITNAFNTQHVNNTTYGGKIVYSSKCIFCGNSSSNALMNDGGSFRQCQKCKKNFRAQVLTETVQNYSYSTSHLNSNNKNV